MKLLLIFGVILMLAYSLDAGAVSSLIGQKDIHDINTVDVISNSDGIGVWKDSRLVLNVTHKIFSSGIEYDLSTTKINYPLLTSGSVYTKEANKYKYGYNFNNVDTTLKNFADTYLVFDGNKVRINQEEFTVKVYFADNLHLDFYDEINRTGLQISKVRDNVLKIRGVQSYDPVLQFNGCITLGTGNSSELYEMTSNISCAGTGIVLDGYNNTLNGMGYNITFANDSTVGTYGIKIVNNSMYVHNFSRLNMENITANTVTAVYLQGNHSKVNNVHFNYFTASASSVLNHDGILFATSSKYNEVWNSSVRCTCRSGAALEFAGSNNTVIGGMFDADGTGAISVNFPQTNNFGSTLNGSYAHPAPAGAVNVRGVSTANKLLNHSVINSILTGSTGQVYGLILSRDGQQWSYIANNYINASTGTAVFLESSTTTAAFNNIIENNRIIVTTGIGIEIDFGNVGIGAYNNTIRNNLINVTGTRWIEVMNQSIMHLISNLSYNPTISGTNIIEGNLLGGNFYANSTHTGYSQICTDATNDGICDTPISFNTTNVTDFYPLSDNFVQGGANAEPILNITVTGPTEDQLLKFVGSGSLNHSINYTTNYSGTQALTYSVFINGTFNHSALTNTTLNLSHGSYQINVSAFNTTHWSSNSTRRYQINITLEAPAQPRANLSITGPLAGQFFNFLAGTVNHSINYTTNYSGTAALTYSVFINGTFNHSALTNTTLNLSHGSYQINVSAFNGSVFSVNDTRQYYINLTPVIAQFIGNATIVNPIDFQSVGTNNHSLEYTQNGTSTFSYTWFIYLNGTFNKSVTTNTTMNLSTGNYTINVSAYNGSVWSRNFSVKYAVVSLPAGCISTWTCTGWVENLSLEYRQCTELSICGNLSNIPPTSRQRNDWIIAAAILLTTMSIILYKFSEDLEEQHWPMKMVALFGSIFLGAALLNLALRTAIDNAASTGIQSLLETAYGATQYFTYFVILYLLVRTIWWFVAKLLRQKDADPDKNLKGEFF